MTHAAAIWFVVARLCIEYPTAPEGFACLTHRFMWYEGEAPTLDVLDHPAYTWRDVQMTRVVIPAIKPRPPLPERTVSAR